MDFSCFHHLCHCDVNFPCNYFPSCQHWQWCKVICSSFENSLDIDQKAHHSIFSGTEWHNKYFIPVGCFLLLHIGEFVGSTMASFIKWPKNTHIGSTFILALALLRIVFIPLLLFCNIAPKQRFVTSVSNIMYLNVYCMFASKKIFLFLSRYTLNLILFTWC